MYRVLFSSFLLINLVNAESLSSPVSNSPLTNYNNRGLYKSAVQPLTDQCRADIISIRAQRNTLPSKELKKHFDYLINQAEVYLRSFSGATQIDNNVMLDWSRCQVIIEALRNLLSQVIERVNFRAPSTPAIQSAPLSQMSTSYYRKLLPAVSAHQDQNNQLAIDPHVPELSKPNQGALPQSKEKKQEDNLIIQ